MTKTLTNRRSFLGALARGSAFVVAAGCGYYAAEEGAAYEPWRFPSGGPDAGDRRFVHAASLAASPHNIQPWLFELGPGGITLWIDSSRSLGAMDPLGRERRIGLGCAIENLVIAARRAGRVPTVTWNTDPTLPDRVADVSLADGTPSAEPLFDAIAQRRTNRGRYAAFSLEPRIPGLLTRLIEDLPSVTLTVLSSADTMSSFRAATIAATVAIIDDSEMLHASDAWYRHTHEDIERHRDGVTLDAQALSHWLTGLGKMSGRPSAAEGAAYWLDNTRDVHTAAASAYLCLSTPTLDGAQDAYEVGRAYERIHLWLTANGLAAHPLNQVAERRDREQQLGLPPDFGDVLRSWVPSGHVQMLFRVGYAWEDASHSPRRAVTDVLGVPS